MAGNNSRYSFRIPASEKKILRWYQLGKLTEKGYVSPMISTALKYLFFKGEVPYIGTVDSQKANEDEVLVSGRFDQNDIEFMDNMKMLTSGGTLTAFLIYFLNQCIVEGENEEIVTVEELKMSAFTKKIIPSEDRRPVRKSAVIDKSSAKVKNSPETNKLESKAIKKQQETGDNKKTASISLENGMEDFFSSLMNPRKNV